MQEKLLNSKTNHASGVEAEEQACKFLRANGFKIIQERYKCKHGEIDIIAQRDELLVFVEVKKRGSFGADDPITQTQKKRIINAAMQYLSDNPEKNDLDMRFDSILVDSSKTLAHIEDAWRLE